MCYLCYLCYIQWTVIRSAIDHQSLKFIEQWSNNTTYYTHSAILTYLSHDEVLCDECWPLIGWSLCWNCLKLCSLKLYKSFSIFEERSRRKKNTWYNYITNKVMPLSIHVCCTGFLLASLWILWSILLACSGGGMFVQVPGFLPGNIWLWQMVPEEMPQDGSWSK